MKSAIIATVCAAVFCSQPASASAGNGIRQIRHNHGQITLIDFQPPSSSSTSAASAGGALARNMAQMRASQLLQDSQIRPHLLRGARHANQTAAAEAFVVRQAHSTAQVVRFQRQIEGIPVWGEEAIVDLDAAQNVRQLVIHAAQARLRHALSASQPEAVLRLRALRGAAGLWRGPVTPHIHSLSQWWVGHGDGSYSLQYQIDVSPAGGKVHDGYRLWLDASSGLVVRWHALNIHARDRAIYDLQNQESGEAVLRKTETANIAPYAGGDTSIEELFTYMGHSYDYFHQTFNRDSIDGNGATIKAIAHVGQGYNNAYWCGCAEQYFGFGDGDGKIFGRFSQSLHVVGHEYTHAVTQYTAGLEYLKLSGALNEAMSDMFGKLIEARVNNNTVPDWLVGKEFVLPGFGKPALRNMKDPHQGEAGYDRHNPFPTSSQPEHLDEIFLGAADGGGVHINSSLPNKMMQLLVDGGSHRGVSVNALPLNDVGRLLYHTLSSYLTANSDLYAFVDGMKNACSVVSSQLQSSTALCQASVVAAARAVGLNQDQVRIDVRLAGVRQITGNGDARLDAGETVELVLDLFNRGSGASQLRIDGNAGGAIAFNTTWHSLASSTSFGDRQRSLLRGTVNSTVNGSQPVTLTLDISGRTAQTSTIQVSGYGSFDPASFAVDLLSVPTAFDVDGDGTRELIVFDQQGLNVYNPISGNRTSWMVPRMGYAANFASYQVAVDDFALGDVRIIAAEGTGRLRAYSPTGQLRASFDVPYGAGLHDIWGGPSPVIADLDGDGSKEIIYATGEYVYIDPATGSQDPARNFHARVYVLDKNLKVKTGWPVLSPDVPGRGYAGWQLAVGDLNNDGKQEIVVTTDYHVMVLDNQGRVVPGWPRGYRQEPVALPRPTLADINRDGKLDIVIGGANSSWLHAFQHTGDPVPGFPLPIPLGVASDTVIPADLNGDGNLEFVLATHGMGSFARASITLGGNYQAAVIDSTGAVLPGWPKPFNLYAPVIADVTGDGLPDIVGGDSLGLLHVFNRNGVDAPGFPLDVGNGWRNPVGASAVGDFNGDGKTDLAYTELNQMTFGASNGYRLHQFNTPWNSASSVWPLLASTPQNTGAPARRVLSALNFRGTPNNWGLTPMTYKDGIWSVVVKTSGASTDRFKLDASSNWSSAWGDANNDGFAGLGEADIYFNKPAGNWLIRFNESTRAYTITAPANLPPVANAGAATASVTVNQPLALDGSASSDPEGRAISCSWSWTDAGVEVPIASSCVTSWTPTRTGTFTVTLKVTDDKGLTATATKTVTVNAAGSWQRTVIFIYGQTSVGQDMFIRGGIDHGYAQTALGRSCTQSNMLCAVPIRHRNLKNATTNPWKSNDGYLDWYGAEPSQSTVAQGTPLDWTTNRWDPAAGALRTVDVDGYGQTPLNTWGAHYWMLDVDMDCSKTVNGWFEVKSFISNGPGWEPNVSQPGAPWPSGNHFAQCGKLNMFVRGQNSAVISNLP